MAQTAAPQTAPVRQPAHLLAERLANAGTEIAFGVPGGGPNLDMVAALQSHGIRFVLAHGETAAGIMAATWGHLHDAPGVVVVTRGPGAASVVNAAAAATLDRQPVIVITDTVPLASAERVAHQRIDQTTMLAPVTKASVRIGTDTTAADLDGLIALATDQPPGAVHLDYDVGPVGSPHWPAEQPEPVAGQVVGPQAGQAILGEQLRRCQRPVVILGRAAIRHQRLVRESVERIGGPVLTTYQAVGTIPTNHHLNAGLFTNGASERPILEQGDLIVTIGLDLVEPIPAPWTSKAPVVSLSPYPTTDPYLPIDTEIVGDLDLVLGEVSERPRAQSPAGTLASVHRQSLLDRVREQNQGFAPTDLVDTLIDDLPPNLVTTVDAGAHFLAIMPLWPVDAPDELLISNGLATMGSAVPAAIGAALARPGQPILALVGDGGLSMTLGELETIARLDLPVTVVVFNDAALSLIEIKQEADHGGPDAVRYRPTDFAAIAAAMGLEATIVTSASELRAAWAQPSTRPRLLDARIDPSQYRHLMRVTRG